MSRVGGSHRTGRCDSKGVGCLGWTGPGRARARYEAGATDQERNEEVLEEQQAGQHDARAVGQVKAWGSGARVKSLYGRRGTGRIDETGQEPRESVWHWARQCRPKLSLRWR